MRVSTIIPESFRLFVSHEKSELSAERTIQTTNWRYLARHRKSLSLQLVASVNSNFLSLCKATVGIYGKFYRAVVGFSFFKSLWKVSGKGQVRRYVEEVWTFAQLHKSSRKCNSGIVAIMAILRMLRNFDNRLSNLEDSLETNNPIAYNLNS